MTLSDLRNQITADLAARGILRIGENINLKKEGRYILVCSGLCQIAKYRFVQDGGTLRLRLRS